MDRKQLAQSIKRYAKESILDIWEKISPDNEYGGYLTDFDRTFRLRSSDKGGWGQGRSIYNYAYAYEIYGNDKYLEYSKCGIDFVLNKMFCGNGRFSYLVDRQGQQKVGAISVFSDAFIIAGIAKYTAVSGDRRYKETLAQLYETFVKNITDVQFADIAPQKYDRDVCHHSLMMIGVNVAYEVEQANVCDVSPLRNYCLDKIFNVMYDDVSGVVLEKKHLDGSMVEGDDFVNVGHVYECMWFVMETALKTNDVRLFEKARRVADSMFDLTQTDDGMLFSYGARGLKTEFSTWKYEIDFRPDDKVSWAYAEAMYLWLLLYETTGQREYLDRFEKIYSFTNEFFIDRQYGDWFHALDRNNNVVEDFKGSTVKCPYHMTRAYWRIVQLLERDNKRTN